jgi:hypothetical protein
VENLAHTPDVSIPTRLFKSALEQLLKEVIGMKLTIARVPPAGPGINIMASSMGFQSEGEERMTFMGMEQH